MELCSPGLPALQEKDLIRLKREAKAKGGFYVEPEAKLLFVVSLCLPLRVDMDFPWWRKHACVEPEAKLLFVVSRLGRGEEGGSGSGGQP